MTPIELMNALESFIKEQVKDICLAYRSKEDLEGQCRAPGVYKMKLPDKESETKLVPYVLLQFLTGKDAQATGQTVESECKVRLVIVTYSEDGGIGAYDLLNVITRIRTTLLKAGMIADQFLLKLESPLEYIIYPDDTDPYHMGEMMTTWELPAVEREIREVWQ